MTVRVYSLVDVLKQLNGDSTQYLAPNSNEIVSQFVQGEETAVLQPGWTETTYTPYPFLVADRDGPVGFWMLSDPVSSTTAFDSSPYPQKIMGVVGGTVTFGVAGGPVGSLTTATFDGTSGNVLPGNSTDWDVTASGFWTIECWCKPTTTTPGTVVYPMTWINTVAGTRTGLRLVETTTGKIRTERWCNGVNTSTATSGATMSTSNWNHVVGTWDGTNTTIYLNGTANVAADATAWGTVTGQNVRMGSGAGTNFFGGGITLCAIYPATLSAQQVTDHFNWASAANETGAYTYGYGAPTKYGFSRYPNPPGHGSSAWGLAVWGGFTWG